MGEVKLKLCPFCGGKAIMLQVESNFCPNCGAKMDEVSSDE